MTPTQKVQYFIYAGIIFCTILAAAIGYKYLIDSFKNLDEITYEFSVLPDSGFAFRKQWNYNENVFKDKNGRFFCDGFCPDTIEQMKDGKGRIKPKFGNIVSSITL